MIATAVAQPATVSPKEISKGSKTEKKSCCVVVRAKELLPSVITMAELLEATLAAETISVDMSTLAPEDVERFKAIFATVGL
jgi:3-hydroxyisobutyrate dehydrogenase-like beta-hydroxyacid dehydrogenase